MARRPFVRQQTMKRKRPPARPKTPHERAQLASPDRSDELRALWLKQALDSAREGPGFESESPAIGTIVAFALRDIAARRFDVQAFASTIGDPVLRLRLDIEEIDDAKSDVEWAESRDDDDVSQARRNLQRLLDDPDFTAWQRSLRRFVPLMRELENMFEMVRSAATPPEQRARASADIDAAYARLIGRSDENAIRFDIIEAVRLVAQMHLSRIIGALGDRGMLKTGPLDQLCPGWREPPRLALALISASHPDIASRAQPNTLATAIETWGTNDVWSAFANVFREARSAGKSKNVRSQYQKEESEIEDITLDPAQRAEAWRQLSELLDVLGCGRVSPEIFEIEWQRRG